MMLSSIRNRKRDTPRPPMVLRRSRPITVVAVIASIICPLSTSVLSPTAAGALTPATSVACTTTTPITYGPNSTVGSIATAGADACFTFNTSPGDVVWLNMAPTKGSLSLFLDFFRPGPISTCAGPYGGATNCPVPTGGSGTWTLQISDAEGTHTGSFRLSIQRLDIGVNCKALKFGHTETAHLKKAADSDCYTFTGSSGEALYARTVGTSGTLVVASAIESSATGTEQCVSNGTVECSFSSSGTQTLLLYSESGTDTGTFRLYAQVMTAPQHCVALTVGGSAQRGSVSPAGDVACFTFAGSNGDTDVATLTGVSGTLSPEIDFFRPAGTSACASPGTTVACSLDATGTWTILIYDGPGTGTGTFSIAVTKE